MTISIASATETPLLLTVPGLENSGNNHWQTRWEADLDNCARADLGDVNQPGTGQRKAGWVDNPAPRLLKK